MSGQALPPLYPVVADALHAGTISAAQASVIEDCMRKLPTWVSQAIRTDVESRLVHNAPKVRLKDLREIFSKLMGYIDPDGSEPKDSADRSAYNMSMRAKANGDWELRGLLDPVTGGTLNGLLTSRIQSARDADKDGTESTGADGADPAAGASGGADAATAWNSGADTSTATAEGTLAPLPDKELLEIVDAVLSGERYDAKRVPAPDLTQAAARGNPADVPGVGVVRTAVSSTSAPNSPRRANGSTNDSRASSRRSTSSGRLQEHRMRSSSTPPPKIWPTARDTAPRAPTIPFPSRN